LFTENLPVQIGDWAFHHFSTCSCILIAVSLRSVKIFRLQIYNHSEDKICKQMT